MPKTFFITTAIDYTNSTPHVGHAYEKVLADVIARYHRLKGERVFFLTGVDQHGQKVQQSAAKAGVPPAEFVKEITQKFVDLWKKLDVKYDAWAATTDPLHKKVVQGMLQRLFDEGQIYKDKQAGYYSIRQEQFVTDKERGPDGEFGPEWGQVEFREEENYYFKLEQHKQWLLDLIGNRAKTEKPFVIPDFRETELRNAVERLSGDLCISRPKSRLNWGIELPFDRDYVNYVWFDALTNYISFAGYDPNHSTLNSQPSTFLDKWPALQTIGKDILVPAHGIYWPIMLHAVGFPDEAMPQLLVHGWWNLGGAKMSKSAGNIIDPFILCEKYGADALRYYLMSDIATGKDADFSEERLVERYNADLANSLGNLLNRTLNMAHRYGTLKLTFPSGNWDPPANWAEVEETTQLAIQQPDADSIEIFISSLQFQAEEAVDRAISDMDDFDVEDALAAIRALVDGCNFMIEMIAPWERSKHPEFRTAIELLFYGVPESLRIIATLISPVLPRAAHGIFNQLNWKMELSGKEERFSLADAEWGKLPDGHVVGKPVPLFPRIETA
jgi:methionyl-tRNA synthetase